MDLIDTLSGLLGKVSGCPETEALNAMRDTVADFCHRTRCWAEWVASPTTGTTGNVDLRLRVVDVIEAWIDNAEVEVLYQNAPEQREARPNHYALVFEDPSVVTLVPTPPALVWLRQFRALAPGPEATAFPSVIWLNHSEALRDGCLARLFAAPAQAWANPAMATYHGGRFEEAIDKATAKYGLNRKQSGRRLRVRPS